MSSERLEPSIWDIFDPLKAQKWDKDGIRLFTTCPLITAVFGYHEYRGKENIPKYFSPNIDLVTDPMRALGNDEHIGIWVYVTNFFVPAAMLSTVIGIKIKEEAEKSEDNHGLWMAAWVFWWAIRGPLIAMALFIDALKRVLFVMTVITLVGFFSPVIIVAAACLLGAALLLSKKNQACTSSSEDSETESETSSTEPSHESPIKLLVTSVKKLFSSIKIQADESEHSEESSVSEEPEDFEIEGLSLADSQSS